MENNEQSNNMAKKGVGLLIIIGALLIVVMGLGGYILYDKFGETKETENTEEKKEEKKEEKIENLEVTSKEVTDLFCRQKSYNK